jgi:hypothetical protein
MQVNGQFILMNRDEFKKWLFEQTFTRVISIIQEHHTYIPAYTQFNGHNHFDIAIGMKNYHVNTNGWSDIAQNLTIYPDGLIMVCRPFNKAPAGIVGANEHGLCIENIGNFDVGGNVMTTEQKESIIFVAAVLCMKLKLTPSVDTITYHHWWDLNSGERVLDNTSGHVTKSCPGSANFFGGNTTVAAKANLYPLVIKKINELSINVEVCSGKKQVVALQLNVRQTPIDGVILGQLLQNTTIDVTGKVGDWFRIVYNGVNAYVSSKYLVDYIEPIKELNKTETIETVVDKEIDNMTFKDNNEIAEWAKIPVDKISELGIMIGDNEGKFNPKENLTREQFAKAIYNVLKLLGKVE